MLDSDKYHNDIESINFASHLLRRSFNNNYNHSTLYNIIKELQSLSIQFQSLYNNEIYLSIYSVKIFGTIL